jgi:hypothetical protein
MSHTLCNDRHNYNCDGNFCTSPTGEVRRLPYSPDGALILCRACFDRELAFRHERNAEAGRKLFDTPTWEETPLYEG